LDVARAAALKSKLADTRYSPSSSEAAAIAAERHAARKHDKALVKRQREESQARSAVTAEIDDLEAEMEAEDEVEQAISAAEAAGREAEKAHAVAVEEELVRSVTEGLGGADVVAGYAIITEL